MVNKRVLTVTKETKALIPLLRIEYLRYHPEMKGARITENLLVHQAFKFYLNPRGEEH